MAFFCLPCYICFLLLHGVYRTCSLLGCLEEAKTFNKQGESAGVNDAVSTGILAIHYSEKHLFGNSPEGSGFTQRHTHCLKARVHSLLQRPCASFFMLTGKLVTIFTLLKFSLWQSEKPSKVISVIHDVTVIIITLLSASTQSSQQTLHMQQYSTWHPLTPLSWINVGEIVQQARHFK